MIILDQRRNEHYQKYLHLLHDPDYIDVIFDEQSGGVSAIHIEHQFDKSISPFGYKRGDYELASLNALRQSGHCIILGSELSSGAVVRKSFDGFLDGMSVEIKSVESDGRWAIRTKICKAINQGARIIVLYFPLKELFSRERVVQGWKDYVVSSSDNKDVLRLLCVVESKVIEIEKPSW